MIKHIVMWKLPEEKDGLTKVEIAQKMKSMLEELYTAKLVPELCSLQVGINFNPSEMAYDVCLVTDFKTKEDLNAYQNNEHHLKVATYIRATNIGRCVADYEY